MASSIQNHRASSSCFRCMQRFNMWCWRAFKWLPVIIITLIIGWSYYAYVIQLCFMTVENTVEQCFYLIFYHLIFIMFCWSYWRTIFTEGRPVPEKYKLPQGEQDKLMSAETEDAQRVILDNYAKDLPIYTRTMSGAIRYCNRCILVKPDRAHHCSICSRCVLKMDHHCPWVNNCVCFHNYKFFMLFLGYALLYCFFIMSTTLSYFIRFWKGDFGSAAGVGRYHIVFAFCVALMFGISLGSLFSYHCYLVAHNRTTLEAFRAPMFRGGPDKNGFSLGAYNNFKEVFGNSPNLWAIPVFTSFGEGSEFPVRREHQLQTFTTTHESHYESMGTTHSSFGDGIVFPQRPKDEDSESLLSADRWGSRWEEPPRPFDEYLGSSSCEDI